MLSQIDYFSFINSNFYLKIFLCLFSSYALSAIAIKIYLNYIKNSSLFHQPIRTDGPEGHFKKNKTPTFGGLFLVLSTILSSFLFLDLSNKYLWIIFFVFLSFCVIGFVDDFLKVFYKDAKGFKGSIKLLTQFLIVSIAYLYLGQINEIHANNHIFLPILDGIYVDLGQVLYVIMATFIIVGSANSTNLTDGLDGLVSVPAIINLLCLIVLIVIGSNIELAQKYQAPYVRNSQELIFFCIILIGAIIGFLQFNLKPAKIFMGDVGSLAIGSCLGLIALIIKQEIIFIIVSLLFIIEALSVILQVFSYKIYKKRIFLMAPIHHHFEKLGWSEVKVVRIFWLFSLICAILGMSIILL